MQTQKNNTIVNYRNKHGIQKVYKLKKDILLAQIRWCREQQGEPLSCLELSGSGNNLDLAQASGCADFFHIFWNKS